MPLPPGLVSYHPPAVVDGTVWFPIHQGKRISGPFHAVGDGIVYAGVNNGIVALTSDE